MGLTLAQFGLSSFLPTKLTCPANRLYTQIPVNVRISRKTTYLPKGAGQNDEFPLLIPLLIPKGSGVAFSAYHMHRSKEIYGEDANEFRPERWEEPELKNIRFAFMPFHGGPRLCLGSEFQVPLRLSTLILMFIHRNFVLMEASYGLVRLLQEFPNLRMAPDAPKITPGREKQSLTIVISSAEGCKVLLHLAESHLYLSRAAACVARAPWTK